jgi:hypothetical protein
MPKTDPKELNFPTWSEVSKYGINTLGAGDTVKAHFHDCNEFWIVIGLVLCILALIKGPSLSGVDSR